MSDQTLEALKDISEVFKFELWLRFYFIQENDGKIMLKIEDQVLQKMKDEYEHLAGLAEQLNNTELSPAECQKAIVDHVFKQFDGKKYEMGYVPKILDMAPFKAEIQLFNTWAHLHEDQLDKNLLSFTKWNELYDEWKRSENAQKMEVSLSMQNIQNTTQPASNSTN
ncbi:hypothetical protein [Desulfonatronovibrio magnus]|uniref:hypothetical protein n=1 Tax=Desulfonatronovibrio magnus TaxID=698827 RepID=UPI000697BD01|nr:hypothetical protein [Desulfonatronovibrio magnus]